MIKCLHGIKNFIKDRICTFFYMPFNFGTVMRRIQARVEKTSSTIPDWLCLSNRTSRWNIDIYLAVDKEIPGADNCQMSGSYYSRVYEGNFRKTGKWSSDFVEKAEAKGLKPGKLYCGTLPVPNVLKSMEEIM